MAQGRDGETFSKYRNTLRLGGLTGAKKQPKATPPWTGNTRTSTRNMSPNPSYNPEKWSQTFARPDYYRLPPMQGPIGPEPTNRNPYRQRYEQMKNTPIQPAYGSNASSSSTSDSSSGSYGGGDWGGWGGGGYSEPPAPPEVTWSQFGSAVAGAPAWWKAMKPSAVNEDTEYLAAINMLIPFLSPEDQKTAAATIYQMDAKNFGHLNPEGIRVPETRDPANQPGQLNALAQPFTTAARAKNALSALTELAGAVGKSDADLGPGYRYLRSILDAINQYSGQGPNEGQTRAQYQQMLSAVDPLLNQSKTGSLSPYGPLASMLAQPFFYGGQLTPATKNQDGTYSFGTPNKTLY